MPKLKAGSVVQALGEGGSERDIAPWTDRALRLHTYQHHGPDPEGLWGGPVDKEESKGRYPNAIKEI